MSDRDAPSFSLNYSVAGGRTQWPEFVHLAGDCGYDAADFTHEDLERVGVSAAVDLLASSGVKAGFGKLPVECRLDGESFKNGFQALERRAREAHKIGCRIMGCSILSSSDLPFADYYAICQRRFGLCAEVLEANGLRLAVEFVSPLKLRRKRPFEFVWNLPQALEFAAGCGSESGVLLDSWHWHHSEGSAQQILNAGDMVLHLHFADAAANAPEDVEDLERLLPGEGVVNWAAFVGALRGLGYVGGISPEIFGSRIGGMAPESCAKLALETSKWIWDNC
jgi:sugar phosphate isomerase/epimerase